MRELSADLVGVTILRPQTVRLAVDAARFAGRWRGIRRADRTATRGSGDTAIALLTRVTVEQPWLTCAKGRSVHLAVGNRAAIGDGAKHVIADIQECGAPHAAAQDRDVQVPEVRVRASCAIRKRRYGFALRLFGAGAKITLCARQCSAAVGASCGRLDADRIGHTPAPACRALGIVLASAEEWKLPGEDIRTRCRHAVHGNGPAKHAQL